MNLFSLGIAALFGLLVLGFAVLLFSAIVFNLKVGQRYRQRLAREIERLRLSRMLNALGIDVGAYLHHERILDIRRQMHRCEDCAQTTACDDTLSKGRVEAGEIDFCNNEQALQEIVRKESADSGTK